MNDLNQKAVINAIPQQKLQKIIASPMNGAYLSVHPELQSLTPEFNSVNIIARSLQSITEQKAAHPAQQETKLNI